MNDFIDKLRTAPPAAMRKPYYIKTWGFDPDMRHCGWAVLLTEITPGQAARPVYWNAGLIVARNLKLLGDKQVENMIAEIEQFSPIATSLTNGQGQYHLGKPLVHRLVIESQEFYSGSNVDVNDLIHLAQVAGALYGRIHSRVEGTPELIRPRTWKGNKQKQGMHARARRFLESTGQDRGFTSLEQVLKKDAQHAMDALCMAVWLMGRENKLPVFGED